MLLKKWDKQLHYLVINIKKEKGYILGLGVYDKGDVKDKASMQEAYELGENI